MIWERGGTTPVLVQRSLARVGADTRKRARALNRDGGPKALLSNRAFSVIRLSHSSR
jgi:hypothetical protein